jgi:hypothetical protein
MPAQPIPVPRPRAASASLALAVFLLLSALFAAGVSAAPPAYKGASADGEVVFFESEEQLVAGDTDNKRDVYARSFDESVGEDGAYVTREVSTGPTGGNDAYDALFEEASADGEIAFFSTEEPLTAGDADRETDVYARFTATGTTKLVSSGAAACLPACGKGGFDAGFAGATADGSVVFLVTAERLDPLTDGDSSVDVYGHDLPDGPTSLVSAGGPSCQPGCGNGEFVATLRGISPDGTRAFFASTEPLDAADTDAVIDIYARDLPSGPTSLVSAGDPACAPCGNGADAAIFAASSADGDRVFFASREKLVSSDNDGANDIYRRTGGVTTLVSDGTANQPANFAAVPGDGSRVFFVTAEPLAGGADTNAASDVYVWEGGAPQLLTSGKCCGSTFAAVTADAGTVFFTTTEALSLEDGDGSADIYERDVAGGAPVLISAGDPSCAPCGDDSTPARFSRASADGTRVLFTSAEQLSAEDFDNDDDIYVRAAGETMLSTPASGPCPTSDCHATFVGASSDGVHVFFQTSEAMVLGEDPDSEPDIYERAYDAGLGGAVTRLISTGNSVGLDLGPAVPELKGTVPGPSGPSTQPAIVGQAEAGSAIKIYRTANCSGEPVATGSAAELADPGIAATVATGSTTSFWATAEADGFTSLCSNSVSYKQEDVVPPVLPSPPPPSNGSGSSGAAAAAPSPAGIAPAGQVKTHGGVAYVAPSTRITFGPAAKTRYRQPVFRFTDSTGQPGTRFSCSLDRRNWKPCGSPTKVARLKPGKHVFKVKAVNAVGTPESHPASRSFKVVAR